MSDLLAKLEAHTAAGLKASPGFFLSEGDLREIARCVRNEARGRMIDIVFDGPPDQNQPHFIEVEDAEGRSIKTGEWIHRPDGYWALRIKQQS